MIQIIVAARLLLKTNRKRLKPTLKQKTTFVIHRSYSFGASYGQINPGSAIYVI